jgi:hypothetical protein
VRNVKITCLLIAAAIFGLSASRAEDWHDPSPHQIRFVSVQPGVKIETLDWGGTGRPLILIAGAGGTAAYSSDRERAFHMIVNSQVMWVAGVDVLR